MAFIGVLLVMILMGAILLSTLAAIVLFIVSMVLFLKNRKKDVKKRSAIITLIISIVLFLPMIIAISSSSIYSYVQDKKEREFIASIENKVIVEEDEWKKGFKYKDINLVPVNLLMNSYNYRNNLNEIGALVIDNTNIYYNLYELDNDSGYKIYYVWVHTFTGGGYYSRTFVDENDYDSVLEYYNNSNLNISVLWRSAPQYTKLSNSFESLNLNTEDIRDDLLQLSHEVLDDISNKNRVNTLSENYDDSMEFIIDSDDSVFTVDLVIYTKGTKGKEIKLYLNEYEVEEKIVEKHRGLLLYLINESQSELLKIADEIQQN